MKISSTTLSGQSDKGLFKNFIRKYYRLIFPVIHILTSFVYERFFFIWDTSLSGIWSVPVKDNVSNEFEFWMTYGISKIISIVLIFLIWKLVFAIIDKKIRKKTLIIFGILFIICAAINVLEWPESIIGDGASDNVIAYYYSLRFIPYYWQSIFTGCLYSACFMVAPTAFALPVLQPLALSCVMGYAYTVIEKYTEETGRLKWTKYLVLTLILLPQFYDMMSNPWRCCLYTIIVILFFTMIIDAVINGKGEAVTDKSEIISENKRRAAINKHVITVMFLAVILSVWRSEGILYGALGFLAMLIWGCRYRWKQIVLYMLLFFSVFYLAGRPSAIGQKKYYGNDYLKVCFINPLSNIFNDSEANLDYDGAEEDIAAIEKVVPVSILRQYNYFGYLSNNYSKGYEDIDQSGSSDEDGSAFTKAAIRIILHNPVVYIKTQLRAWELSLNYDFKYYIEPYHYEKDTIESFPKTMWEQGNDAVYESTGVSEWGGLNLKKRIMWKLDLIRAYYIFGWNETDIKFYGHILLIVLDLAMVIWEISDIFRKKYKDLAFGWIAVLLLGVLAATVLMIPATYEAYFHSFNLMSYLLVIIFAVRKITAGKTTEKKQTITGKKQIITGKSTDTTKGERINHGEEHFARS